VSETILLFFLRLFGFEIGLVYLFAHRTFIRGRPSGFRGEVHSRITFRTWYHSSLLLLTMCEVTAWVEYM